MFKTYETELAGRKLVFETGKMAGLANGSVLVRYGDTCVLVNVTASKEPREGIDFFPLSVDFEEKLYAVGKIPGGFLKREGKPTDKAILTSRAIDRPLRPLFPKDFRNDVVVVGTVLCVEQDNSPEVAAMIGAATALAISDIPFNGPTAAVNVGLVDGQIVINPTVAQREHSRLKLTVAGTMEKVTMIEAGADEIPNDTMLDCIKAGHEEIKKLCKFIEGIKEEVGKPKFEYVSFATDKDVYAEIKENFKERMYQDVQAVDKEVRDANMDKLAEDIQAYFVEKYGEEETEAKSTEIANSIHDLEKECVREMIFKEHKRPDGRRIDEIRPLSCEVGVLPRVHGSAIFTRGQTQVLSVVTLGTKSEEQELDGLDEETGKIATNFENKEITVKTGEAGEYEFTNVKQGKYIVVFKYDTKNYRVTEYQKQGINEKENSDVVSNNINLNGQEQQVAMTKTLELSTGNLSNIDAGFVQGEKFDLRLDKYISKIIIQDKTGTTVKQYDNTQLAKIELDGKKIAGTTVIVEYKLQVTNEGEVGGYVNEVFDNKPSDLDFSSAMNNNWYQSTKGELYTKELSNQMINPGETKTLTLTLTKTMNLDNTGTSINTAELNKVSNNYSLQDIDSTPGNRQTGEDDMSTAQLIISVKTGSPVMYISLIIIIIGIISVGVYLIKKEVLIDE